MRQLDTSPGIITVAITGAIPTKSDNPAVPISPSEQIESAHEAFEEGATVCHIHVRDSEGRPSSDPGRFAEVQEGIRRCCPGMIIQFSTGARGRPQQERAKPLELRPDMASLATGSVNFPQDVYSNPPSLVHEFAQQMLDLHIKPEIEVFDLAMLYSAAALLERGLLALPLHVQLVLGITNALPVKESIVDFFASEIADVLPGATWTCAGIGKGQALANRWSLERGGHIRTGLEDNIFLKRGRLAASNAELVRQAADVCHEFSRPPATPAQARALLLGDKISSS